MQTYSAYLAIHFPSTPRTYSGSWVVQKGDRACSRIQHLEGDHVLSTVGLGNETDERYEQLILAHAQVWFGGSLPPYEVIRY